MELEEMKSAWKELSTELEKQKKLTNDIILKMAHKKSASRLSRIIYAESIGSVITLAAVIYLISNFHKLNDWLSLASGVLVAVVFMASILMSMKIVFQSRKIDLIGSSLSRVIENYNALRNTLRIYKKVSMAFYVFIPFIMLPVFSALFLDKSLLNRLDEFVEVIIASALILPVSWWLVLRFYKSNMSKVSEAIRDIKEQNKND